MKLTKYVAVRDPENNQTYWFHPGDEPPSWAAALITNPSCWEQEKEPEDFVTGVDYTKLRIVDLDVLLEERGLPLTGSKKEKAERLKAHDDTLK